MRSRPPLASEPEQRRPETGHDADQRDRQRLKGFNPESPGERPCDEREQGRTALSQGGDVANGPDGHFRIEHGGRAVQ
jgi:hypothetical protein